MRIDLMDMGQRKYGDCIVIQHEQKTILIDGAHNHDSNNLGEQLEAVLGHPAPFKVDLLVITHCHDDHIGQLPELVADGTLTATTVLAADEKFGWGLPSDDADSLETLSERQRGLVTALLEEDRSDLPTNELEAFVQDSAKLIDRYRDMLGALADGGSAIVRYGRDNDSKVREIEQDFSDFGLKILGPTQDHLITCAEAIRGQSDAIMDRVAIADDTESLAATYRRLRGRISHDAIGTADQPGVGAAKNDQSIILKVKADGWSALLAGDMQFAKAEVPGLGDTMKTLRAKIAAAGPYDFVKLTHHTSYNGVDESVLDEYQGTKLFGHTGGRKDPTHPDPDALELLKQRSRDDDITLARTDRNGRITVEKEGGKVVMSKQKGRFNDFTENRIEDVPEERAPGTVPHREEAPRVRIERVDGNNVEVVARLPHTSTRVTVTIDVAPVGEERGGQPDPKPPPGTRLNDPAWRGARMRSQPGLLFVTHRARLEPAIGGDDTARVLDMIAASGGDLLEIPDNAATAEQAAPTVRAKLSSREYKGVVIVGGYDVVPPHRLDVLDAALRNDVIAAGLEDEDADNFIVWSDELYGDDDGDFMPELPVSRIPDGRHRDVVKNALTAPQFSAKQRYGIRNLHRPFAQAVFPAVPGGAVNLEVCEVYGPEDVIADAPMGAIYLMLHGSARDASRYWGETKGGATMEAFAVENVPEKAAGSVVLTGCCWGALTMSPPAARARSDTQLQPRNPESSIAIAYLKAGAHAFVGCTGSHYSPLKQPYDYYGKPMHEAFWRAIAAGRQPAEALFRAKAEYARNMPHGQNDPFSRAVELKTLRQFTCLGLGW